MQRNTKIPDNNIRTAGKTASKTTSKRILILFFAVIVSLSLVACAAKKPYKKLPPAQKKPSAPAETQPSLPPEPVRTNATPSTSDVITPKRQASMRLVTKAAVRVESGEYELAAATLRDAINIDSTNGVAYYYLAECDLKLGQPKVALGLLDKAEALLGADSEWMSKIDELRENLGEPASKPLTPSPIDQTF